MPLQKLSSAWLKAYNASSVDVTSTPEPVSAPVSSGDTYTLPIPPQQAPVQVQNPATWDYKTAQVGLRGETLPIGAKGWKPDGNPDFGSGFLGLYKEMNNRVFNAEQKAFTTAKSFAGTDPFTSELFPKIAAFGAGGQQASSELFFAGLNAMMLPVLATERIAGTLGYGVSDLASGIRNFVKHEPVTLPNPLDLNYWKANWEASRGAFSSSTAPFIQDIAKFVENKIAEGAKNYGTTSDPTYGWLAAQMVQQESFGKVALNAVQLRDEFIRRMNNGESPDNIQMDMGIKGQINPWSTMVMQFLFDPMNASLAQVWGMKGRGLLRNVATTEKRFATPEAKLAAEGMAQGFKTIAATGDEVAAAEKIAALNNDVKNTSEVVYDFTSGLGKPSPNIDASNVINSDRFKTYAPLIPASRRTAILNDTNMVVEQIVRGASDPITAINELEAAANLSKGGKIADEALANIYASPSMRYILSPAGNETGAIVRHILEDDPKLLTNLRNAAKVGGTVAVGALMQEKMAAAVDKLIPDAKKVLNALDKSIEFERVVKAGGAAVKLSLEEERLAAIGKGMVEKDPIILQGWRAHIAAQEGVVGKANAFYSALYMGASLGSYPARNFVIDTATMFADHGPRIFFKSGDVQIAIANKRNGFALANTGGMTNSQAGNILDVVTTEAGSTGITDVLKSFVIDPETGKWNKLFGFIPFDSRKANNVIEKGHARQIVGYVYNQFYEQQLGNLVKSISKDARFSSIDPGALKAMKSELMQSGNVEEAFKVVEKAMSDGFKWDFKEYDNLAETWRNALDAIHGQLDWQNKVLTAATEEEALTEMKKIIGGADVEAVGHLADGYVLDDSKPEHILQIMAGDMGLTTESTGKVDAMMGDIQADLAGRSDEILRKVFDAEQALPVDAQRNLNQLKLKMDMFLPKLGTQTAAENRAKQAAIGFQGRYGQIQEARRLKMGDAEILKQVVLPHYQNDYKLLGLTDAAPKTWREYTQLTWEAQKAQQVESWNNFYRKKLEDAVKYIDEAIKSGVKIDPELRKAAQALVDSHKEYTGIRVGQAGALVIDHLPPILKGESQVSLVSQLAKYYGVKLTTDQNLLRIINKHTGTEFTSLSKDMISMERVSDAFAREMKISPLSFDELSGMFELNPERMAKFTTAADKANTALAQVGKAQLTSQELADLAKKDNPFYYFRSQKTPIQLNPNEMTNVFGQTSGKGIPVGFAAKEGQGLSISEIGDRLVEGRFMNKADAADDKNVREFLRKAADVNSPLNIKPVATPDAIPTTVHAPVAQTQSPLVPQSFTSPETGVLAPEQPKLMPPPSAGPVAESQKVSAVSMLDYKLKPFQSDMWPSEGAIIDNVNRPVLKKALEVYIKNNFNKTTLIPKSPQALEALKLLKPELNQQMTHLKLIATSVAQEARNFTILNYGKRAYGNVARAYLMPYGFWYEGTIGTWARRVVDNPAVLAGYAKYKQAMALENAAAPDYMKQNIEINNVFGIPLDNPLFFNLEQSVWPLNGITGEDFTDPTRAANWWSYTWDSINKIGPSTWTPFNVAVGLALKAQGNQPASDAWLGRLSSNSLLLKRLTGVETDPFVGLLQGGMSPTETNQVVNEMAKLVGVTVAGHTITQAEFIDAANSHSGPLWDIAVKNSNANHLTGQVASSVFGLGLKPKTQDDLQIDQFYNEYFTLFTKYKGGFITKDDFRQQNALLAEKYPFSDGLLIGKRGGPERDTALAYNVLSRIPPGDATALMKFVGIDNATVNRFYNDGGDISKWTVADQTMFNGAILQLAATFQMPNLPTKQEWNATKAQYDEMRAAIAQQLGSDIWTKMDTYYEAKDAGRGSDFLALNPDVQQALDLKEAYVANNPLLSTYYGGIDTIQRYYEGQAKAVLVKKYGQDIYQFNSQYYSANSTAEKKQIMAAHPQLKAFQAEKALWTKWVMDATVKMGAKLQDKPALELRPATSSTIQASLGALQNQRKPTAAEWQQVLGTPMFNLIADTLRGKELSYQVQNNLDFEARKLGYYDGDALLTDVLVSIQQQP